MALPYAVIVVVGLGGAGHFASQRSGEQPTGVEMRVADLVAHGRCADAINTALTAGSMGLAAQAKAVCPPSH